MVIAFSKLYPACQTDGNGIKPGSILNHADKRVAEPFIRVYGHKLICTRCLNDSYNDTSEYPGSMVKLSFSIIKVKVIQE